MPDRVPPDLVKRCGSVAELGDKVGGIMAMIVLEITISNIEKETMANFPLAYFVLLEGFLPICASCK